MVKQHASAEDVGHQVPSLGQEDALEEEMTIHSSLLGLSLLAQMVNNLSAM